MKTAHFLTLIAVFVALLVSSPANASFSSLQLSWSSTDPQTPQPTNTWGTGTALDPNAFPAVQKQATSSQFDIVPTAKNESNPLNAVTGGIQQGIAQLTAYSAIYGGILIASGLMLVFWGHKLFKPILFVAGFYFFSVLSFTIMQNIEVKSNSPIGGDHRDLVYLIVLLVCGLLGGALTVSLWKLGFFAIGAALGYVVALFFLVALKDVITGNVAHVLIIVAFCLVFGALIFFLEMPILISSTSLGGAYATFVGIDVFAQTGLLDMTRTIGTGQSVFVDAQSKWAYMFGGAILLAIIGLAVQIHSVRQAKWKHTGLMHRDFNRGDSNIAASSKYQPVV